MPHAKCSFLNFCISPQLVTAIITVDGTETPRRRRPGAITRVAELALGGSEENQAMALAEQLEPKSGAPGLTWGRLVFCRVILVLPDVRETVFYLSGAQPS